MHPARARDVVAQIARFGRALRERGVRVGLSDEVDAARALALIDVGEISQVRDALRIALKIPREHWTTFDELFDRDWRQAGMERERAEPRRPPAPRDRRGPLQWQWDGRTARLAPADNGRAPHGDQPGYSPDRLHRRPPFADFTPHDLARIERTLAWLARRWAMRRSRRLVPAVGRGAVDLRRSLRRAVATRGEVLALAHRVRARHQPRLVVLCDTSGSMDPHVRPLLTFMLALRRALKHVEIFAFNTTLTRLTRRIHPANVARTLERLARDVPDWSGGTQLGACLAEFVTAHQNLLGDRTTIVVVFSDGLDLGEPATVREAMRALRARARAVVWLNPLLHDARYQPRARGMQAALPYVDHLGSGHDVPSLEHALRQLARCGTGSRERERSAS